MPIIKVYYTDEFKITDKNLASKIEKTTLEQLKSKETKAEVIFIKSEKILTGKKLYIEIICKKIDFRNDELYQHYFNVLKTLFPNDIDFKIRLIQLPENEIYFGFN
ncbi:MAG TPA: hypothetical protein QF753_14740 [Victivallales bacterium]|nr:hypothetical protein [Victivallales bacterium]